METFSALLAICAGNSPIPDEFPTQRPVTRNFDVFFDLNPNKRLNKQWWGWWFETPSCPLWRHRNGTVSILQSSLNRQLIVHPCELPVRSEFYIHRCCTCLKNILDRVTTGTDSILLNSSPSGQNGRHFRRQYFYTNFRVWKSLYFD